MGAIQYVVPGLEETGGEEKVVSEEQKSRGRKGRDQATKASELAKICLTDYQRAPHGLLGWKSLYELLRAKKDLQLQRFSNATQYITVNFGIFLH